MPKIIKKMPKQGNDLGGLLSAHGLGKIGSTDWTNKSIDLNKAKFRNNVRQY